MINSITIDGIVYKLIFNPNKLIIPCGKCDLFSFCQKELNFEDICNRINSNNYYKTVKQ